MARDEGDVIGAEVLTSALVETRVDDVAAAAVSAGAPWGFWLDVAPSAAFAAVTGGACWLRRPAASPVRLEAGDLTLMPFAGTSFGLASSPHGLLVAYADMDDMVARKAAAPARLVDLPGPGPCTSLICGSCTMGASHNPLLEALPPFVSVRSAHQMNPGLLDETLRLMSVELSGDRPGAQTVLDRLVDVLFVLTVRSWLALRREDPHAIRRALADPQIATAIACVHADPARRWTIRGLAAEAGLSRTTFVRRFTALVGEPPSTYLANWRLGVAAKRIR